MLVRKIVTMVLSMNGYSVIEADGARSALSLLEAEGFRIKLLLTDLSMPEIDGFELIREVKQLFPSLKIVVMTGSYHSKDIVGRLNEFGLNVPLRKPFTNSALIKAVKTALAESAECCTGRKSLE